MTRPVYIFGSDERQKIFATPVSEVKRHMKLVAGLRGDVQQHKYTMRLCIPCAIETDMMGAASNPMVHTYVPSSSNCGAPGTDLVST